MQEDNHINMQHHDVDIQLIYDNMHHNFADMQHNLSRILRHNYAACRHDYVAC